MRVGKAKRRWIRWCRYIQKTQSGTVRTRGIGGIHYGQSKAHQDVMFAHTWVPKGARAPWYPRWGSVR